MENRRGCVGRMLGRIHSLGVSHVVIEEHTFSVTENYGIEPVEGSSSRGTSATKVQHDWPCRFVFSLQRSLRPYRAHSSYVLRLACVSEREYDFID